MLCGLLRNVRLSELRLIMRLSALGLEAARIGIYLFIYFAAMNCHLDALVAKAEKEHFDIWAEVLDSALAA
jgi:hypothetical protein